MCFEWLQSASNSFKVLRIASMCFELLAKRFKHQTSRHDKSTTENCTYAYTHIRTRAGWKVARGHGRLAAARQHAAQATGKPANSSLTPASCAREGVTLFRKACISTVRSLHLAYIRYVRHGAAITHRIADVSCFTWHNLIKAGTSHLSIDTHEYTFAFKHT
jgi:hypothetical protein